MARTAARLLPRSTMQGDAPARVKRGQQPTDASETKAETWKRLAQDRAGKAVYGLRNIRKLADREFYEYTNAEAEKVVGLLRREVDAIAESFKAGKEISVLIEW